MLDTELRRQLIHELVEKKKKEFLTQSEWEILDRLEAEELEECRLGDE